MFTGLQEPKKRGFEISMATDSNRLVVKFLPLKVVWYPKMDQKVCLNMAKKDQLCGIALKKRN